MRAEAQLSSLRTHTIKRPQSKNKGGCYTGNSNVAGDLSFTIEEGANYEGNDDEGKNGE